MTNNGEQFSFLALIDNCTQIVIPIIQRDYAQGRKDPAGQSLCKEVRENFLREISNALLNDSPLVLDYIYGANDGGFFYPIDGQQRLTTLFLLHWYIGTKEKKLDEEQKTKLKKFSYATRDTAKEFCSALTDIEFDISNTETLSKEIKNSTEYFYAYDEDPTIQAMLIMLDEIHAVFKNTDGLWEKLGNITFWCLSLERFGLTDDLFVKMNARGKRLSRFDTFKADLESALDKRLKKSCRNKNLEEAVKKWKIKIDNDYLDGFWTVFGKEYAERNMFRLIIFLVKCLNCVKNKEIYNDVWEKNDKGATYKTEVETISSDAEKLNTVCGALETFSLWKDKDPSIYGLLIQSDGSLKEFNHHLKVILFGVIYWFVIVDKSKYNEFDKFYRILINYVTSNREYNNRTRQFNSNIDSKRVWIHLFVIKQLIEDFNESAIEDFYDFVRQTKSKDFEYERQKLNYGNLDEIKELERLPILNGLTNNFFFDDKVYIKADELKNIVADPKAKNLCLRIILSYGYSGSGYFSNLVFDGINMQSGKRQLYYNSPDDKATAYCHKYFIKEASNEFGDKVFTADNRDALIELSRAVKSFAKEFNEQFYLKNQSQKTETEVLNEILSERLRQCDFKDRQNILWYIVKYKEFFYSDDCTTFLVLRRKRYDYFYDDDNVYDIRCTNENFDVFCSHFQPFYLALCNYVDSLNSSVTVYKKNIYIYGNQIEYANPCTLSNGWTVRILHDGDWQITFNGTLPKDEILNKYSIDSSADNFVLKNNGADCIVQMGNFIKECN